MKALPSVVGFVALAALTAAVGGCSQENDGDPTASPSTAAASGIGLPDQDLGPAQDVVEDLYDAIGKRDCFTMRTLSALAYQQDDIYWADGCIDELQLSVGDTYDYTVLSGQVEGQEAVFRVQRPLPDGEPLVEEVVLIAVGGWQVVSRTTSPS